MINPIVLPYLIGVVIALLTVTAVVHIACTIDTHLVKRRTIRESDAAGAAFRDRTETRHTEMLLRLGMNPGYAMNNAAPRGVFHTMCSPSRHGVMTSVSPEFEARQERHRDKMNEALRESLNLSPYSPPPAVYTPEEARASMNVDVPSWDDVVEAERTRMAERAAKHLDKMAVDHMTAIPAPELFAKEEVDAV